MRRLDASYITSNYMIFHCRQASVDITPIRPESSSSSSDEEPDLNTQQASAAEVPIGPTLPGPQLPPAGVPPGNWQLLQQMMMGVAQMQAMFRMPFNPTMAAGGVQTNQEESSSEEETDDEDESDEEGSDEEETESSSEGGEEKTKNEEGGSEEAGTSRQGWELGGKVELKPKPTTAQKRRARRKNLREEYKKMRKGKFWEIREMQKKKYGI